MCQRKSFQRSALMLLIIIGYWLITRPRLSNLNLHSAMNIVYSSDTRSKALLYQTSFSDQWRLSSVLLGLKLLSWTLSIDLFTLMHCSNWIRVHRCETIDEYTICEMINFKNNFKNPIGLRTPLDAHTFIYILCYMTLYIYVAYQLAQLSYPDTA